MDAITGRLRLTAALPRSLRACRLPAQAYERHRLVAGHVVVAPWCCTHARGLHCVRTRQLHAWARAHLRHMLHRVHLRRDWLLAWSCVASGLPAPRHSPPAPTLLPFAATTIKPPPTRRSTPPSVLAWRHKISASFHLPPRCRRTWRWRHHATLVSPLPIAGPSSSRQRPTEHMTRTCNSGRFCCMFTGRSVMTTALSAYYLWHVCRSL